MIIGKKRICLVAEYEGNLVGYLIGYIQKIESIRPVKRGLLEHIYIKDEFKNKGIGTRLIDSFIQWSKEKREDRILMMTYTQTIIQSHVLHTANTKAIQLYQRLGFKPFYSAFELSIK